MVPFDRHGMVTGLVDIRREIKLKLIEQQRRVVFAVLAGIGKPG